MFFKLNTSKLYHEIDIQSKFGYNKFIRKFSIMISIIIPAKNEAAHIGLLLRDIQLQSLKSVEVIVSSSSTDKTNQIAKSFGAKVTKGTVDGCVGKARNFGAAKAKGEILIFLDADVRLPNRYTLANLVAHFKINKMEIANSFLVANSDKRIYRTIFYSYNLLLKFESYINVLISAPGICLIVNRKLFESIGGFDEELKNSEDIDLIRRIMKLGHRYNVIPFRVTTSVRRFENKNGKELALLMLAGFAFPVLLTLRWKFLKKYLAVLESFYGETGGTQ
jgi:glycosyltransferase involved in cell wall biosynthesis